MRFFGALGMGGEWALGVALVMELWPNTSRAWLAGWIGAFGNLGYLICGGIALGLNHTEPGQLHGWLTSVGTAEQPGRRADREPQLAATDAPRRGARVAHGTDPHIRAGVREVDEGEGRGADVVLVGTRPPRRAGRRRRRARRHRTVGASAGRSVAAGSRRRVGRRANGRRPRLPVPGPRLPVALRAVGRSAADDVAPDAARGRDQRRSAARHLGRADVDVHLGRRAARREDRRREAVDADVLVRRGRARLSDRRACSAGCSVGARCTRGCACCRWWRWSRSTA